jgi:hypothetical protein
MRYAPNVSELYKDATSCFMYRFGNTAPARYLFDRMNSWSEQVAATFKGDLRTFSDDEACASALPVIERGEVVGDCLDCAGPGHGRHHDSVWQLQSCQVEWLK